MRVAATLTGVRFRANNSERARFLMSHHVADISKDWAEEARRRAIALSPTGDGRHPGKYKASFVIRPSVTILKGGPRRSSEVVNEAPYAAQVEWGIEFNYEGKRRQGGSHGIPARPLGKAAASFPDHRLRRVNSSRAIT